VKHFLITLFFCANFFSIDCYGQNSIKDSIPNYKEFTNEKDKFYNEYYYYLNLFRVNPKSFFAMYIVPNYNNMQEYKADILSLKNDIAKFNGKGLPFLNINSSLVISSSYHATDLSKGNRQLSHNSANGMSFASRMAKFKVKGSAAENIYGGDTPALDVLCELLIDNGIMGYGHRKTLLNPKFTCTGFKRLPHGLYTYIFIQDFASPQ
jgi:uncharacterized protein YkwD